MAVHFHKLKVKDIRHETQECVSVSFLLPDDLKKEFEFLHGQNITLKKIINGEEIRRSYSICSAPFEDELRIAVKNTGLFSDYINHKVMPGDEIEVLPPTGKFNTQLNKTNKKKYLAFAAGSGITPIISIIKATLNTEQESSFTLIYCNKNRNSIIFSESLQATKNKNMQRFNLVHLLSREKTYSPINTGRINSEKLVELNKMIDYKSFDEFFICGPEAMIFCVKDFLELSGIDKLKIHFELFTIPGEKTKTISQDLYKEVNTEKSHILIKADGRPFEFDLNSSNMSILDAALLEGADLPFACKGGVCASCKAKLLEGNVVMDSNYALEPEEIEQGFILCCQAHPQSKNIVIDFDVR